MKCPSVVLLIFLFTASVLHGGPIELHPRNRHYFLFRGEPTILVTSGEHYGAVLNLDFDYARYLKTLHADGLNYTRIFNGVYMEDGESFSIEKNTLAPAEGRIITPWARSAAPGYRKGGNKFNLDTWNDDYFQRLRDFVSTAGEYGIVVEVTLFTSIYNTRHWTLMPFHPDNNISNTAEIDYKKMHTMDNGGYFDRQERMVRKIVRELNAFDNVIFEIQNEPWPDQTVTAEVINPFDRTSRETWYKRVDIPSPASISWQEKIVSIIQDEESVLPNSHLIAQNYCNFFYPVKDVIPGVSIINFHYAWPEAALLNYGWNRVIGFDESGFAGNADSTYRKQAWKFILSGGGLFNNLDYSFAVGFETGTYRHEKSPGGGSPILRRQLAVLKNFMHGFSFVDMYPDRSVVKKAPGVYTYVLAETGKQYAVFVNGGEACELDVLLPEGSYEAEWIDTKNGGVEKRERIVSTGGTVTLASPEYISDIALRILKK